MKSLSGRFALLVVAVVCSAAVALPAWSLYRTYADDRNADGRPDVWRDFDAHGELARVAVDSNFDGRSDVQEFYDRGVLVRRESDRNFDDRVDLVEEFDRTTREHVRSLVDVDYDGTADLLVLFRDGRPVSTIDTGARTSRGARVDRRTARTIDRSGEAPLAPLNDPFRLDLAVRATPQASGIAHDIVGLSTSGGLPSATMEATRAVASSSRIVARDAAVDPLALSLSRPLRGPPAPIAPRS